MTVQRALINFRSLRLHSDNLLDWLVLPVRPTFGKERSMPGLSSIAWGTADLFH